MRTKTTKAFISTLFLFIFLTKMIISVAPLIIAHFDSKAVNAAIMQLEIEHPKSADAKDTLKEYFTDNSSIVHLWNPVLALKSEPVNRDREKHIQAFYPSVPTPPPNA